MKKSSDLRMSNIELLRILSIVLILLSHTIPKGLNVINIENASLDIHVWIFVFLKYCGQIGNVLFVIISSYFLVGNSSKVSVRKIAIIIVDTTIISMIFLISFAVMGIPLDRIKILNYCFPTIFNLNYWFIGCYILFYTIHPLLNVIITHISKKELLYYNIAFVVLYCIFNIILVEPQMYYTDLLGFCGIYFIVAYVKLYKQDFFQSLEKNRKLFVLSFIGIIAFIMASEYVGLYDKYYYDKILYYCKIYNPFIIGISISIFNIFYNFVKIPFNRIINYFASLSLLIYAITDNYILREEVRNQYFNQNMDKNIMYLFGFEFLRLTICGFILAIIYDLTIRKFEKKLLKSIYSKENEVKV